MNETERRILTEEREALLRQLDAWLEAPMLVLGFVWLALLVAELTVGLSPVLEALGTVIWIVFILDFALKFTLAPRKIDYLKGQWLTAISLLVPALRVIRVLRAVRALRAARAVRGVRLVRVVGSLNRGMRGLGRAMGRRRFGYVLALTSVVTFAGAAGMYAFEKDADGGLSDYGTALWWTAMIMVTTGSDYWPETAEGRVLCVILALYAFGVFGYVTATLATYFVGRDAEDAGSEIAGAAQIESLRAEIAALRAELRSLLENRGPLR